MFPLDGSRVFLAAKMKMIPNTIKEASKPPACTECFDIPYSVNIIISSNTTYGYFNPFPASVILEDPTDRRQRIKHYIQENKGRLSPHPLGVISFLIV